MPRKQSFLIKFRHQGFIASIRQAELALVGRHRLCQGNLYGYGMLIHLGVMVGKGFPCISTSLLPSVPAALRAVFKEKGIFAAQGLPAGAGTAPG